MVERCVCCGEIIPEGQQTCPSCKKGVRKMAELKPCPFCGGREVNYDYRYVGRNRFREEAYITFLKCDICGAQTKAMSFDGNDRDDREATEAKVMEAWNRRAEDGT